MTVEANGELKMLIMVPATNTHYSVYLFSRHLSKVDMVGWLKSKVDTSKAELTIMFV